MKKLYSVVFTVVLLFAGSANLKAQSDDTVTTPMPIGGISAIMKNVVYPAEAKNLDIQGQVIVKAIVDEKGSVEKVEVLKSVDEMFNKAVIDAIMKTKFIPGKQKDGKQVKASVVIPVNFRLK